MHTAGNIILRTGSYKFTHWKQYPPGNVRLIQSDGVDFELLERILEAMEKTGFSADNIAFGSGGGLLQKLDRDTLQFAFKCAAVTVNGVARDVFKQPVTDPGKQSKSGRMKLIRTEGPRGSSYQTVKPEQPGKDQLVEVFRDGKVLRQWRFSEVRDRARTEI